jgi:hypothetical protein
LIECPFWIGWIVSFFKDVSQEQIDEYELEIEQAGELFQA